MQQKYNYLESICSLLLSHGMTKIDDVIYCKLSDREKLLLLEFISTPNLSENKLCTCSHAKICGIPFLQFLFTLKITHIGL